MLCSAQSLIRTVLLMVLSLGAGSSSAGPIRDWLSERQAQRTTQAQPAQEIAYGADPRQRFDLYRNPSAPPQAPVIFMVHGGGWRWGSKSESGVVANKVARWVAKGFVVISTNYRLLPTPPLQQAKDVALALATAQQQAQHWGADPRRFVLMGHSAGAHLISLLNARPDLLPATTQAWLGSVVLDSAAFNVPAILQTPRHLPLYDAAFGQNPEDWVAASPLHQLHRAAPPMLAVCSSQRQEACPQAHAFAAKAARLQMDCRVLEQSLSHREINQQLGEDNAYTAAVEAFLRSLDPELARRLTP